MCQQITQITLTVNLKAERGKLESLDQDQITTTCNKPASPTAPSIATTTPTTRLELHESRPIDKTELYVYDVNGKDRKNEAPQVFQRVTVKSSRANYFLVRLPKIPSSPLSK